jgi:hypothetical protein
MTTKKMRKKNRPKKEPNRKKSQNNNLKKNNNLLLSTDLKSFVKLREINQRNDPFIFYSFFLMSIDGM